MNIAEARDSAVPTGKRIWQVGTLTYTAAGLAVLFGWLLWGDFTWNLKERAITPVAQIMLRGFSAPDWLVGLLVGSLPAGIGLILGPLVCVKSDHTRTRWGRRIPFLLIPTPFIALAMFGLGATPSLGMALHEMLGAHSPGVTACRLAAFGMFWTAFEILTITVNCLFGALINDVVPQGIIGRFFALFRAVGLIAGIIFNYWLMGKAETHSFEIFVALGLLYGIGFTLMCLKVKEGDYPPPPRGEESLRASRLAGVMAYFKESFSNPFYLAFFFATTLGMLALAPVNTFSVFHARSVGMGDDLYGKCLALSYAVSLVLAYPLGILADRFHPVRLGIFCTGCYAAVTAYGFAFATDSKSFFIAFLLHTVLAGTYLTATASIGQRLLPKEKFGQFASAGGIIGGVLSMILPPALGVFIERMNHDYRFVFLLGFVLTSLSAITYIFLYRGFLRQGGDTGYRAP
jgi:Na+/melibiose symporter-like transporter